MWMHESNNMFNIMTSQGGLNHISDSKDINSVTYKQNSPRVSTKSLSISCKSIISEK